MIGIVATAAHCTQMSKIRHQKVANPIRKESQKRFYFFVIFRFEESAMDRGIFFGIFYLV
jgi:hypothetical protein